MLSEKIRLLTSMGLSRCIPLDWGPPWEEFACGPIIAKRKALHDVLRLAEAMSKKAAISGLKIGGGKAVIIGNPITEKTRPLLLSMGRLIDSLKGKYLAAKDSGILPEDLDVVAEQTRYVTGNHRETRGQRRSLPFDRQGRSGWYTSRLSTSPWDARSKRSGGGHSGRRTCGMEFRQSLV